VLLNRDFDGHYIAMAPGEKSKCLFYPTTTPSAGSIAGRSKSPSTARSLKFCPGLGLNVAPRLATCLETAGNGTRGFFRVTPPARCRPIRKMKRPCRSKAISTKGQDHFDRRL